MIGVFLVTLLAIGLTLYKFYQDNLRVIHQWVYKGYSVDIVYNAELKLWYGEISLNSKYVDTFTASDLAMSKTLFRYVVNTHISKNGKPNKSKSFCKECMHVRCECDA